MPIFIHCYSTPHVETKDYYLTIRSISGAGSRVMGIAATEETARKGGFFVPAPTVLYPPDLSGQGGLGLFAQLQMYLADPLRVLWGYP